MENYPFTLGYIESTFHTTFLESPEAVSRSCPADAIHLNVHTSLTCPFDGAAHLRDTTYLLLRWRQANKRQITDYETAN